VVGGIQTATVTHKQNLLSLTEQLSYTAMITVTDFRISTLAVSVSGVAPSHTINDHMLVTCLSHACRVLVTCIHVLVRC